MKKRIVLSVVATLTLFMGWTNHCNAQSDQEKNGPIKIMILYPHEEGKTFDFDYYTNSHMPMVAELFGEPLKSYTIEKGISGRTADERASYIAIGTFYFETLSAYEAAFGANAEKILSDIPNYTNIQPTVQISEMIK